MCANADARALMLLIPAPAPAPAVSALAMAASTQAVSHNAATQAVSQTRELLHSEYEASKIMSGSSDGNGGDEQRLCPCSSARKPVQGFEKRACKSDSP